MSTESRIEEYLEQTIDRYEVGAPEYYGRLALEQALIAHQEGNYGIGAVAVAVGKENISEYRERNAMFTGLGVVDHAETRALLAVRQGKNADLVYPRDKNEHTAKLPEGLSIYGTLEPCMMCDAAMINAGASKSISTVQDGELIEDGYFLRSDGGATVLGEKHHARPVVWGYIQEAIGLEYSLLETQDKELKGLSLAIFGDYREAVDLRLAERGKAGN